MTDGFSFLFLDFSTYKHQLASGEGSQPIRSCCMSAWCLHVQRYEELVHCDAFATTWLCWVHKTICPDGHVNPVNTTQLLIASKSEWHLNVQVPVAGLPSYPSHPPIAPLSNASHQFHLLLRPPLPPQPFPVALTLRSRVEGLAKRLP